MLRALRVRQFEQNLGSRTARWALWIWAMLARRPWAYRLANGADNIALRLWARGRITAMQLAGG